MDRFIACKDMLNAGLNCDLKSNMDRFIGNAPGEIHHVDRVFKIQYG